MNESDLVISVSAELYAALQRRADENQRTVEEEVGAILIAALENDADMPS